MATKRKEEDKAVGHKYAIQSKTELEEARWLIEQGLFKDMDDYIHRSAQAEINYIKYEDAKKKKQATARKKKIISGERSKAA